MLIYGYLREVTDVMLQQQLLKKNGDITDMLLELPNKWELLLNFFQPLWTSVFKTIAFFTINLTM